MTSWSSSERVLWVAINDGAANFTFSQIDDTDHTWSYNYYPVVQDPISVPVFP